MVGVWPLLFTGLDYCNPPHPGAVNRAGIPFANMDGHSTGDRRLFMLKTRRWFRNLVHLSRYIGFQFISQQKKEFLWSARQMPFGMAD
jgi:hypothetical protein